MSISIQKYETHEDIQKACEQAIGHRLYVPSWELGKELRYAKEVGQFYRNKCYLAFDNNVPVGILWVIAHNLQFREITIMIFVKKAYRKKGIGSRLMNAANLTQYLTVNVGEGIEGSQQFFDKVLPAELQPLYMRNFIV